MIETFYFSIILYVDENNYFNTIESIIEDKDFFMRNIQLVIVDGKEEAMEQTYIEELEEAYMGNVKYVQEDSLNKIETYRRGLLYCSGKYVTFVDAGMTYEKNALRTVKSFSENQNVDILGIHICYNNKEENVSKKRASREAKWTIAEELLCNPLCLNRYFIRCN